MAAYKIWGTVTTKTPMINFCKSLMIAAILPLAAAARKSLISKMLAEATAVIMKKGMRMAMGSVKGLISDRMIRAKGTGT